MRVGGHEDYPFGVRLNYDYSVDFVRRLGRLPLEHCVRCAF